MCARFSAANSRRTSKGRITFPKRVISHTQKTQYLFRINKGLLDMAQDVNDHMDAGDSSDSVSEHDLYRRRADGCALLYRDAEKRRRSHRGLQPGRSRARGFKKCYQLSTHADRVKHIAPADYRPGTHLRMLLEQMVEETANRIVAERRSRLRPGPCAHRSIKRPPTSG